MPMRNLSFLRWRVIGLLLSVVVIVALPYVITRNTSTEALHASQWVTHSSEVKSITYRIAFLSRDADHDHRPCDACIAAPAGAAIMRKCSSPPATKSRWCRKGCLRGWPFRVISPT